MTEALSLQVEVAGCPTVCRHCWAQGVAYRELPAGKIEWVLDAVRGFCEKRGLRFSAYPMHEVAAHSEAARVIDVFAARVGGEELEPLSTTGVPLAARDDWHDVLAAASRAGTTTVWLACHGTAETHDRAVNRPGALSETLCAVERARAAGLRVGCNLFVTKESSRDLPRVLDLLERRGVDEFSCEPASFYPTARGRRYERGRPAAADLEPHAEVVLARTRFHRDCWARLADWTEAAHVERAVDDRWADGAVPRATLRLVCRPNLDVHAGWAGLYRTRYGNLRTDGAERVLERALAVGARRDETLWFGDSALPEVGELAARFGDPAGDRVHFTATSARYVWLDRARAGRS